MPELEPITRLTRDIRDAAITLSDDEARYLVNQYYIMQEDRKRTFNQVRALDDSEKPNATIAWFADQASSLEKQIARALDYYTESSPVGRWARSIHGIGPIIAAGLMAHIKLDPWRCKNLEAKEKCKEGQPCTESCGNEIIQTASAIWRFAGLDPSQKWEKGQKRPWNADLKLLAWKIGESFVKVSGKPESFYGKLYAERKQYEIAKNEAGDYREQAERILTEKNFSRDTEAKKHYLAGRLPPAHIHSRAKRYAVKIFLAHYHHVAYEDKFGMEPPLPYAIAILGHAHHMKPVKSGDQ